MAIVEYTEQYEISQVIAKRPHVVILGAGASRAAFPGGEKNERKIPLLRDVVDFLGLHDLMKDANVSAPYDDFESIYSSIAENPQLEDVRTKIESKVFDYFSKLELPDRPTLYDHLVLSLRPKDIIATFNWDPFLWQAAKRNHQFAEAPQLLFLHGSVAIGKCTKCKTVIQRNTLCPNCGRRAQLTPILYPVAKKNYSSDVLIAEHWKRLQKALQSADMLTFFGYGAPKTDVDAIGLLEKGWGSWESRAVEQIENINQAKPDESIGDFEKRLYESWSAFIHKDHHTPLACFYRSFIAQHPRRSCEAFDAQYNECMFTSPFPIPKDYNFNELYAWLNPRVSEERRYQKNLDN